MKCQSLFSGKNKKNIINLLSAEFAHSTVSVNANEPCNVKSAFESYANNESHNQHAHPCSLIRAISVYVQNL